MQLLCNNKAGIMYELRRFYSNDEETVGILLRDGTFLCWTLEDEHREEKVAGETRIPAGTYSLGLRKEGKMTAKYDAKYKELDHSGMVCIFNKPNWVTSNNGIYFQYCYFHIGNEDDHTEGCVLVGKTPIVTSSLITKLIMDTAELNYSEIVYKQLYPIMAKDIKENDVVTLIIRDLDR